MLGFIPIACFANVTKDPTTYTPPPQRLHPHPDLTQLSITQLNSTQHHDKMSSSFQFPREYHFPPFFTPQPNLTTHHAQLTKWSSLILSYTKHHRLFKLSLSSASESDLFSNRRINRHLGPSDIREVIDFMRKDGRAEYAGGDKTPGDVVFVYWRKPEEWAGLVEAYVEETAQKGSVLTVYELTDGEGTRGTGTWKQIVTFSVTFSLQVDILHMWPSY